MLAKKISLRSIRKEMREHPWATKAQAKRIARDHMIRRRGKRTRRSKQQRFTMPRMRMDRTSARMIGSFGEFAAKGATASVLAMSSLSMVGAFMAATNH